jgi:hypothetical protein
MTPGPLRRLIGMVGLIALTPTALMLASERIDLLDAAVRAGATLLAATAIGRVAGWWVDAMARSYEDSLREEQAAAEPEAPRRRQSDRQPEAVVSEAG